MKLAAATLVVVLLLAACGGRDPGPYVATLDSLSLPATWQVAQTTVQSQGGPDNCIETINGHCPSVTRYYLVDAPLPEIFRQARDAATNEGFTVTNAADPACNITNSSTDLACFITATKGEHEMTLDVTVYWPGADVDGLGLSKPNLATVRLILHRG